MPFISLTRLRIRSIRFLPAFILHTLRSVAQLKNSGLCSHALLADRRFTFWTLTAWDSEASMRAFMISGSHKKAMPHLLHWCNEASVANWTQDDATLPTWLEAAERMRTTGRASKVLHPSPNHATLNFPPPRTTAAAPTRPL